MSGAKDARKPAFRIAAKALAGALKDVCEIAMPAGKSTVPVLTMVMVQAGDGKLVLHGSDLDHWIIRDLATNDRDGAASAEWIKSIKPFAMCVPARALLDICKTIDGDAMVDVIGPGDSESRAVIKAGRARFKIVCTDTADFPLHGGLDWHGEFSLAASVLRDVFASVEHAISTEETRYYLNGIYMHAEGLDQRFAATDGHRLARHSMDGADGVAAFPAVIIGRRTVAVLDKLLDAAVKAQDANVTNEVEVAANAMGSMLSFTMPAADGGEVTLMAKAIDGSFPDYWRVIPSAPTETLVIDRAALIEAIKCVASVAEGKTRLVKLDLSDGLATVSSHSIEIGEASEDIGAAYDGKAMTIGFDSKYWREALGAIATDSVVMRFTDAAGPVLILPEPADDAALVQVVMPVRV